VAAGRGCKPRNAHTSSSVLVSVTTGSSVGSTLAGGAVTAEAAGVIGRIGAAGAGAAGGTATTAAAADTAAGAAFFGLEAC
jgi:hypothetical protein